jgi:thiosulfate/3-mercaptopyruvate sulfurtransferase
VLDARSAPRFAGEDASIDPRPGHIPGADNVYWVSNIDPGTRRFRTDAELRDLYAAHGIERDTDVVCYCGSGVSACADLLALERIGIRRTRLYVPSWSGWSADPSRAAATCGVSPRSEQ